ncbi:MAG: phosphate ABC transporter substrate-binding protein PstS [Stackebrandtia sp.]
MNINARGKILPLVAAGALVMGAAACGGGDDPASDLSGELSASGASFPDAYYQAAIEGYGEVAPDVIIDYNATGSGTGKQQFAEGLTDFAGTDSLVEDELGADEFYYVPTVAAPITVSYNLPDVETLQLSPDTLAQIFEAKITSWDDAAIAEDNPDVDLPKTPITVAHRSDGSGTTSNFTGYLDKASDDWTLGAGDTVEWASSTQGGEKNTGVASIVQGAEGGIGYVDLADAEAAGLQTASIQNQDGEYVQPTLEGTTAGLEGAEVAEDLTYDPLDAAGAETYPITAPTYVLVRAQYDDKATADLVKGFLEYVLGDGQEIAAENSFAALPDELREKALAQLDKIEAAG